MIKSLDHLVLTVASIEETVAFYCGALGMEEVVFGEGRRALAFGAQKINLHQAGQEFEPKAARPMPGSGDLCFLADRPLAEVIAGLEALGLALEDGPVPRTGATGPIMSIYLRDPDGNLVEISEPE
ncbi:MAG: VOC family protein [Pseudomonadota bacterium]